MPKASPKRAKLRECYEQRGEEEAVKLAAKLKVPLPRLRRWMRKWKPRVIQTPVDVTAWEAKLFDEAVLFRTRHGKQLVFKSATTFRTAVNAVKKKPDGQIYAINAAGQTSPIFRERWDHYLAKEKAHGKKSQGTADSRVEPG